MWISIFGLRRPAETSNTENNCFKTYDNKSKQRLQMLPGRTASGSHEGREYSAWLARRTLDRDVRSLAHLLGGQIFMLFRATSCIKQQIYVLKPLNPKKHTNHPNTPTGPLVSLGAWRMGSFTALLNKSSCSYRLNAQHHEQQHLRRQHRNKTNFHRCSSFGF